ncbi:hypothetical protein Taro_044563 [Colocasia esculenta]|uniref:Uncharacterized protein n=1 Tax=Colocasia esculenta TaxID=4460 RepID=A0A843X3H4_COLES|nr:hypothetical protein [Colocasia esculenta]
MPQPPPLRSKTMRQRSARAAAALLSSHHRGGKGKTFPSSERREGRKAKEGEGGRAYGETFLLTWLLGVSRGDTWLFLPDLVEVYVESSLLPLSLEFLLLWLVRDWLSILSLVREAHPPTLFRSSDPWVATRLSGSLAGVWEVGSLQCSPAGSECELQESVAAVAGGACYDCGCYFARTAIGFIFSLRVCVGVSRRLRVPTCGVAFTDAGLQSADPVEVGVLARAKQMLVCHVAPLVECCDTCLWLLSSLC